MKNKLGLSFNFLGPQRLKNISAEVPVYSAVMSDGARPPSEIRDRQSATTQKRQKKLIVSAIRAAAIVAFFAAINLFSWHGHVWFQWPSLPFLLIFVVRAIKIYGHEADEEPSKR